MLSISFRFAAPVLVGEMLATRCRAFAAQTRRHVLVPRVVQLDPYLAEDAGIEHYIAD